MTYRAQHFDVFINVLKDSPLVVILITLDNPLFLIRLTFFRSLCLHLDIVVHSPLRSFAHSTHSPLHPFSPRPSVSFRKPSPVSRDSIRKGFRSIRLRKL